MTKAKQIKEFKKLINQLIDFVAHWHKGGGGGTGYYREIERYMNDFKQFLSKALDTAEQRGRGTENKYCKCGEIKMEESEFCKNCI